MTASDVLSTFQHRDLLGIKDWRRRRSAWRAAMRDAERELDPATTRTALNAAAKKFIRAKAELKRLQAEVAAAGAGERRRSHRA